MEQGPYTVYEGSSPIRYYHADDRQEHLRAYLTVGAGRSCFLVDHGEQVYAQQILV